MLGGAASVQYWCDKQAQVMPLDRGGARQSIFSVSYAAEMLMQHWG